MKAIIITYDLKKMILKDKAKFFRKFHGYTDKSNKAQYTINFLKGIESSFCS